VFLVGFGFDFGVGFDFMSEANGKVLTFLSFFFGIKPKYFLSFFFTLSSFHHILGSR